MITESSKLIVTGTSASARNEKRLELLKTISITTLSLLAAFPTSTLNGFAAMAGRNGNLDDFSSLKGIETALGHESAGNIILGIVTFLVSQGVLTGLNKKYLIGSTKTVLDLIKKDLNYIKALIKREGIAVEKPSAIENILLVWCFLTSLIFAELGKETLAFLGEAGEQTGFYLNLIVYFATRFSGARKFFHKFIEGVDSQQNTSLLTNTNSFIRISGYLLAATFTLPIIMSFIPESVQGLQSLFRSSLSANDKYQNFPAISLGVLGSLPTAFFYGVAIKELPKDLSNTYLLLRNKAANKDFNNMFMLLALTVMAFAASYCTSIGFRLVGTTNIENGYLSYLSGPVEEAMPAVLFLSCILMFWAHLQHLVNEHPKNPEQKTNFCFGFFNKKSTNLSLNTNEEDKESAIDFSHK